MNDRKPLSGKVTWRELNREINTLTENDLETLIESELKGQKRVTILERLHQRFCAVRASRERIELLKQALRP